MTIKKFFSLLGIGFSVTSFYCAVGLAGPVFLGWMKEASAASQAAAEASSLAFSVFLDENPLLGAAIFAVIAVAIAAGSLALRQEDVEGSSQPRRKEASQPRPRPMPGVPAS